MDIKRNSKQEIVNTGKNLASTDAEDKGTSRRKFTRNALVGSAVLLTLGNRSAWGADVVKACISTNVLVSYANGQASAVARHEQEFQEYDAFHTDVTYEQEVGDKMCIFEPESFEPVRVEPECFEDGKPKLKHKRK